MAKKEIKGELLEAKVFPCCEKCDYLVVERYLFTKRKWDFFCAAQGYLYTREVYGSENCMGNYMNQTEFLVKLKEV